MLTAAGGLGKHFCSATQLVFRCGVYTAGTSGSPLLAHVHAATGLGTVIGVIGGYRQGGVTDAISHVPYSARTSPRSTSRPSPAHRLLRASSPTRGRPG